MNKDKIENTDTDAIKDFYTFNISQEINDSIAEMGFKEPTPIQKQVIPLILEGKDVIAQAPTGTGKTCAFGIPVLEKIDVEGGIQAIILCPTRELVVQITNELNLLAKHSKGVKILAIFGGQAIERQLFGMRKNPQVIVGTTGRVMDHLRRRTLKLDNIKMLVLDEADEMLDMGFREDIDTILTKSPAVRQTVLFSATMPKEIMQISTLYQKDPVIVKTMTEETPKVTQYCKVVSEGEKADELMNLLNENDFEQTLIFCNTKKRVDELSMALLEYGYSVEALHGDMRQSNRDKIMRKYRSGETKILVATDVAARGLDINNIDAVVNFDVPHDEEYYVHRIGRTARAKRVGKAYTFATNKQLFAVKAFERYVKSPIIFMDKNIKAAKPDSHKLTATLNKLGLATEIEKEAVKKALEDYNTSNGKNYTFLDLCACLIHNDKPSINISAPSDRTERVGKKSKPETSTFKSKKSEEKKVFTDNDDDEIIVEKKKSNDKFKENFKPRRSNENSTRFFFNIGNMDKMDEDKIKSFVMDNSSIKAENFTDIKALENYSFVEVESKFSEQILALNDMKFKTRKLFVEVALPKEKKQDFKEGYSTRKSKSDFNNKGFKGGFGGKKYNTKQPKGKKS